MAHFGPVRNRLSGCVFHCTSRGLTSAFTGSKNSARSRDTLARICCYDWDGVTRCYRRGTKKMAPECRHHTRDDPEPFLTANEERNILSIADAPEETSNLVRHARYELTRYGEDQDVIEGIVSVVRAFADCGHSGGSAPYAIAYLEKLLRFQPLTPLTNDPSEWEDRTKISGYPLWQSRRNGEAFSEDGGLTYYLITECHAAGSLEATPRYTADDARDG